MRFSSFFFYAVIGMIGIITTGITADKHPLESDDIYRKGISLTLLAYPLAFLARRKLDEVMYGARVTVDVALYCVPKRCPESGEEGTQLRQAGDWATGSAGFPVLLSAERAAEFDRRLIKRIRGIHIVRTAYIRVTLHVKDRAYLAAMREANLDTDAIDGRRIDAALWPTKQDLEVPPDFRKQAIAKTWRGLLGSVLVAGLFMVAAFAGYTPKSPFLLIPAAFPFVYFCIGVIELVSGRPFRRLAGAWILLTGWQRGVLGAMIVIVALFLILIIGASIGMLLS